MRVDIALASFGGFSLKVNYLRTNCSMVGTFGKLLNSKDKYRVTGGSLGNKSAEEKKKKSLITFVPISFQNVLSI